MTAEVLVHYLNIKNKNYKILKYVITPGNVMVNIFQISNFNSKKLLFLTHSKVIEWISKIWGAFPRDILRSSIIQCGLFSSDTREYHQLRHFVQNRTLIDDLTDDDRTSDIPAFNPGPHEELREGHPE